MNPQLILVSLLLSICAAIPGRGWSQSSVSGISTERLPTEKSLADRELDALLTYWVLESIPHNFEDDRKWGQQAMHNTRLRVRRDPDGRVETYRENEWVNHGEWSKFSASLLDPQNRFEVRLENLRSGNGGEMEFDVYCTAWLAIQGRHAKWYRGVQLYSVGAEGRAQVQLMVHCALRTGLDLRRFPPDLVLAPRIIEANLALLDFRLDHMGKFGGEVAQQIGRIAEGVLEEKLAEKETKLVQQLNSRIASNQDKLRISSRRAANLPWSQEAKPYLEPDVQQLLKKE